MTRHDFTSRGYECNGVICNGVEIKARYGVISDAGARNTFGRLLPPQVSAMQVNPLIAAGAFEPSFQLVYLFVGLDTDDQSLNLPATNLWVVNGWNHDEQWDALDQASSIDDLDFLPVVFISFGSAKDKGFRELGGNGNANLQLLAPVRMEWFQNPKWEGTKVQRRGQEYQDEKEKWRDRLLEYLYEQFPELRGHVTFTNVATPLTTKFYLNAQWGENYGLAQSIARFQLPTQLFLHTETEVKGLFMVGQDTSFVGVLGVLGSGALAASSLSKRAAMGLYMEMVLSRGTE
mmetsp:Transcript_56441/g.128021  ORF Transcript_56441/g.128021 Transcript_56441/m.128021 type:complete len:290 (-) Transcript_56441:1-870(-)